MCEHRKKDFIHMEARHFLYMFNDSLINTVVEHLPLTNFGVGQCVSFQQNSNTKAKTQYRKLL
jgi:hypothetical protein